MPFYRQKRLAILYQQDRPKFLLLAAGEADNYPRFGPTMEWDTAAGEAVCAWAGGNVYAPDGQPHRYGKPGWKNGAFIACAGYQPQFPFSAFSGGFELSCELCFLQGRDLPCYGYF